MMRFFILLSCFLHVYAVKNCYDCDPTTNGNCLDPEINNVKVTECDQSSTNTTGTPLEYECFTLLTTTGNNPGTYRGCAPLTDDSCNSLKTIKNIEYDKCKTCSGDRCNNENFGDEKDNSPDSASVTEVFVFALIAAAVFTICAL